MLSKTEIEFLRNPERFDADYRLLMRHRVNDERLRISDSNRIIASCGELGINGLSVTEFSNRVTKFSNGQQNQKSLNHVSFVESEGGNWSLGGDLDPRPLPYQGNAPPGEATEATTASRGERQ